jgi:hypothetical protein
MTVNLEKWLSRKVGVIVLFGVFLLEVPDFDNIWIVVSKIVMLGLAVIAYTYSNVKQNIAQMQYTGTVPEETIDTEATIDPHS